MGFDENRTPTMNRTERPSDAEEKMINELTRHSSSFFPSVDLLLFNKSFDDGFCSGQIDSLIDLLGTSSQGN